MDAPSSQSSARVRSWNAAMSASPGNLDHTTAASEIVGSIPEALRGGRLLSNGPGWTDIDGWVAHPFDGHGYVRAITFEADGSARLRGRFVETAVYRSELEAGRFLHRGLATNGPRFWRNLGIGRRRNVANTTILRWGERLLAGWEGGAPHALEHATLRTLGEHSFSGAIAGQATLAHMHHDAAAARLLLCSVQNGRRAELTFREIDASDRVTSTRSATVPGPFFAHDFCFTPSWFVVAANPLRLRAGELLKAVVGTSTLLRALVPDAEGAHALHLVPRTGAGPVRTVHLPGPAFVIHFANAFERSDGTVVLDVCAFPRFEFGGEFGYTGPTTPFDPGLPERRGPQRLYRMDIPPGSREATWKVLAPHGVDFPRVHPRGEGQDVPVLFGACRADARYSDPFDSIVRVDLRADSAPRLWTCAPDVFVGEPIFVPASPEIGQTAGHVLVIASDGLRRRSTVVILDAEAIERGPIAEVALPLLPVAFHGDWDSTT